MAKRFINLILPDELYSKLNSSHYRKESNTTAEAIRTILKEVLSSNTPPVRESQDNSQINKGEQQPDR